VQVIHVASTAVSLEKFVVPLLPAMDAMGLSSVLATSPHDLHRLNHLNWPVLDLGIGRGWEIPKGLLSAKSNTEVLLSNRPDAVVIHTPATALSARRSLQALSSQGVPLFYVARGSLHESDSVLTRLVWKALNPLNWRLWTGVMVVSKWLEAEARRGSPHRPMMRVSLSAAQPNVPHAPSSDSTEVFTPATKIRLGWVGRFDSDKHPEHMSELIEILERDFGIEAEGVMMGGHIDGDRRRNFRVHPRIEVLGWVDHPSSVLAKCDMNIMTSAREGYALGPLEAALVGTPTVAYRNSGTSESIPDVGGILVAARDVHGLASAVFQYANLSLERKQEWRSNVRGLGVSMAKTSDPAAEMCHFIRTCVTDRTS